MSFDDNLKAALIKSSRPGTGRSRLGTPKLSIRRDSESSAQVA